MTRSGHPAYVAVIGGGPAGLMAAEALEGAGLTVDLYDAMPSLGRKFLMAGKGGLNITHTDPPDIFAARYGAARPHIAPLLATFPPAQLIDWVHGLGVETFVGSSGRVFPAGMKAAPLLRAWLHRLRGSGVRIHARHRWLGWGAHGALRFATPGGEISMTPAATVLALGGASWPQLGADAAWVPWLAARGVAISPLRPANCGFDCNWSEHFLTRFAGQPVKPVIASCPDGHGGTLRQQGEIMITATGIEGGLVYALSSALRETIAATGVAVLTLDLAPGRDAPQLARELARPRGGDSLANHLRKRTGLSGARAALLREVLSPAELADPQRLAAAIKALPVTLLRPRPLAEAISSAGGVAFAALDDRLMLTACPGVFCAGEMLDWEAPTGGYLLTACFASGLFAGRGAADWVHLTAQRPDSARS